nr:MAG TPA: endonuclease [Caudoviricetes sp.]DAN05224.1 MAG TPA: endonuclease [Caudoviricetes sp.]
MAKKTTYTKELINKLIDLYDKGYSAKEIGEKLELDPSTIIKHLKENGIKIRKTKNTQGMIDRVCKEYQEGLSQMEVAKNNKTSPVTVRRILKNNGIPIRKQEEWLRKYDLNQEYFDVIDTQNKAYFLGFLYADGNVSKSNNAIQIGLESRDLHILESFKKELGCINKPLSFDQRSKNNPKHKDVFSLCIKSEHMHDALCNLGVVPRKSHIVKYPYFIPDNLQKHFIRGAMDGDGCIHATNWSNEKEIRSVDICGTYDFCIGLKQIIECNLDIHCSLILSNKTSNIYKMTISGRNQSTKFLDWIYEDAELYLYRKYETYLSKYKSKTA